MEIPRFETKEAIAIEKNFKNAFIAVSTSQKNENNTQYVFSSIPHPVFNCVIDIKTNDHDALMVIQNITKEYKKNNIPHCWWTSERTHPKYFDRYLKQMGFQTGPLFHGMHLNLETANLCLSNEFSSQIRVERIRKKKDLELWIKPIESGFNFTSNISESFLNHFKKLFTTNEEFMHFIAFYNEDLAAAITLFLNEKIAGIYNGAVFSHYQNMGVMSHLGRQVLQNALSLGVKEVVLQANEDSRSICSKVGFQDFLKFQAYLSP